MENILQPIVDIYMDEVCKTDEKGFADLFKKASEVIFKDIEKHEFHPTDIEYLDGYYIFGMGTNSVVHFRVKECKNWKFGIWFNIREHGGHKDIRAEIFGQPEPTDKFKPSRGVYNCIADFEVNEACTDFELWEEDYSYYYDSNFFGALEFIKKHPFRAWGHGYCGYDYNRSYHTGIGIWFRWVMDKFYDWRSDHIGGLMNKSLCKYLVKLIKPCLDADPLIDNYSLEVHDSGEWTSPRYDLQCCIPDDSKIETGLYGAFSSDEEEDQKALEKFNKREKLYDWLAMNIFRFYWHAEIEPNIVFWKKCEWDEEGNYIDEGSEENTENNA